MNLNKLKKLSGDASFRSFYRKKNFKNSSVIVYCKKEKFSNLVIYESINNILIKNNLIAPKLISQNFKNNYIEIEDFGDLTLMKLLKKKKINKFNYYKKLILLLSQLQKIKTKKIKTFLKKNYKIPNYSSKILLDESELFLKWYLPKFIKGSKKIKLQKKIYKIFKFLLNKLSYRSKVFVHRDYHVSNIMITKKGFGIIDSQDALFGNVAYDLASLIDDVRFKTNQNLKDKIFSEFIKNNKSLNAKKLKNDFEILSVLRNLKIIGIFTRLSKRDGKHKYLKLIPKAWKLIENRFKTNNNFNDLKIILNQNFPKKIRKYES
tara:strand:+ start:729 stop:1688 length:960 start_codon:yes stop_codon:yes gene_type:complete